MAIILNPGVAREIYGETFNQIGVMQVDVTVRESHSMGSQVTDKPVEDGTVINDVVILNAARVSISGIMTDDRLGTSFTDKWNALLELRRSREPFTVVTSLAVYEDMIFENISCSRDVSTAGAVFFDADLKNVRIIQSETAQVPVKAIPAGSRAQKAPAVDQGKKQPEAEAGEGAPGSAPKTRRSIGAALSDKVFN